MFIHANRYKGAIERCLFLVRCLLLATAAYYCVYVCYIVGVCTLITNETERTETNSNEQRKKKKKNDIKMTIQTAAWDTHIARDVEKNDDNNDMSRS